MQRREAGRQPLGALPLLGKLLPPLGHHLRRRLRGERRLGKLGRRPLGHALGVGVLLIDAGNLLVHVEQALDGQVHRHAARHAAQRARRRLRQRLLDLDRD